MRRYQLKLALAVGLIISLSGSYFLLKKLSSSPPPIVTEDATRILSMQSEYHPEKQLAVFSLRARSADARPLLIRQYLADHNSPLEPYYQIIVNISDKYSLDYRLLVAIAQQESNLCKKIPPGSHNCWGFGIYGDLVTRFDNYPQALEIVAKALKRDYLDKGLDTPEKIMAKYTPPSLEKGGPWAKAVSIFLKDLE